MFGYKTYNSSQGYYGNNVNYNPNNSLDNFLLNTLKSIVFPNAVTSAPSTLTNFDFQRIQRETALRQETIDKYNAFNPAALALASGALNSLGIKNSHQLFINPEGGLKPLGKITGDLFNRFLGDYAGVYSNIGKMQTIVQDTLRGAIINDQSLSRTTSGVSLYEANNITQRLLEGTYTDSTFSRRRGRYDASDITETFRIGRDYQIFNGATRDQIVQRTQGLSQILQQGQTTFGTEDKEAILQNILRITGGSVALTDSTQISSALTKVKNLARSAHLSIDLLSAVLERGSEVSKQLGSVGQVGSNVALNTINDLRLISSVGGPLNQSIIAQAGGIRNVNNSLTDSRLFAITGNDKLQSAAGVLGAFKAQGLDTSNILNSLRNNTFGDKLSSFQNQLVQGFVKKGLSLDAARNTAQQQIYNQTFVGEQILSQNTDIADSTVFNEVLFGASLGASDKQQKILDKIQQGQNVSKDELGLVQSLISRAGQTFFTSDRGGRKTSSQARALTATFLTNNLNKKEIEKRKLLQEKQSAATNIQERHLERVTKNDTSLERFINTAVSGGTAGDLFKSLLPQTQDIFGIRSISESGFRFKNRAEQLIQDFGLTERGLLSFQAASGILGSSAINKKQALFLTNLKTSDIKSVSDPELKAKLKDKIKNNIPITLNDVMEAKGLKLTQENVNKSLSLLKGLDTEDFNRVSKYIKDANLLGFTAQDFTKVDISTLKKNDLNKNPDVMRIKAELGLDPEHQFESATDLVKMVDKFGDEELKMRVGFLTNKNPQAYVNSLKEQLFDTFKEARTFREREKKQKRQQLRLNALLDPNKFVDSAKKFKGKSADISELKQSDLEKIRMQSKVFGPASAILEYFPDAIGNEKELMSYIKALEEKGVLSTRELSGKDLVQFNQTQISKSTQDIVKNLSLEDKLSILKAGPNQIQALLKEKQIQGEANSIGFAVQEDIKKQYQDRGVSSTSEGFKQSNMFTSALSIMEKILQVLIQISGSKGTLHGNKG